ncbi:MAG: hypothetical protein COX07_00725 [Bacteroidetes bacterium CG23_combo_of_CG06-09_8_20_14_all_32_9]|nr:MAG: hypothetical protein COX07_00725 [Bacteroidetes bacterium CG23_combo_of_CG06-09_8_20_14_all_32_9]
MKQERNKKPWKKKAIERRLENKELGKRLKETKGSRDKWKAKAQRAQATLKKNQCKIERIKKNLKK